MKFNVLKYLFFMSASILYGCGGGSEDPEPNNCDNSPNASVDSTTGTSSCDATDGSLIVSGSDGTAPLEFSIDGTSFQASGEFTGLGPGNYTITVQDVNGCTGETEATIEAGGSDLSATADTTMDTECFTNNGTIEVNASGGQPPYEYSIGDGFVSSTTFSNLAPGSYSIQTQDAEGCSVTTSANVTQGDTGTSYIDDVRPIILANCAIDGCHNGDNGADKDWTNFDLFQSKAQAVKTRTQNGSMPQDGSITEEEKALIACWVDEGAKNN